jgi:hypothetical protein
MVATLVISERLEKRAEVTLTTFPPPIFAGTTSVSRFHVFLPPPRGNASGGLYMGLFRLSWAIWSSRDSRDRQHRRHDGQTALDGAAWLGPAPPMLVWDVVAPSRASSSHVYSQVKIWTPEKASVNLSLGKSLKHQNTQNMYFLFCRVITKIRKINKKSP